MSNTLLPESAALLDGLYAAVGDAGVAHRAAERALSLARAAGDPAAVATAQGGVRARTWTLLDAGSTYRQVLAAVPAPSRVAYLQDRHPYLLAG
jgi:uncharacterized metal-binding protein